MSLARARPWCRVLHGHRALAALRASWHALCDRCPGASPFQRPDWLLWWARCFGPVDLWIVAVHAVDERPGARARRLIGLAPMFRYWCGPSRVLALLGAGISDHLGVLIEPGWERAALEAMLSRLAARRGSWDRCELDELARTSPLAAGALPPGWSAEISGQSVCPVLDLPPRVDALEDHVPRRHLRRFHQYRRRAGREGCLRLARAGAQDRERLLDGLFRLHASRWRGRGEPGVLAGPALRRFHARVAAAFAARDALGLYGLWLDDRLIACLYGFFEARTFYYYLSGFDPGVAHLSPGTLIVGMVIEDAIQRGATRLDFLRGSEPYKYWWGATDQDRVRVCLRCAESDARPAAGP